MGGEKGEMSATARFEELCNNAFAEQEKFLMDRLEENKDTEYGKLFGFEDIHSGRSIRRSCPLRFIMIMRPS